MANTHKKNKDLNCQQASERESERGKGFHEEPDPTCIVKGKPKARKHHEAAIREALKSTINVPMIPETVLKELPLIPPILPSVSNKEIEDSEWIAFDCACPRSRKEWFKQFTKNNYLEATLKGTLAHIEFPAALFPSLLPILAHLEGEFEQEIQNKHAGAKDKRDSP